MAHSQRESRHEGDGSEAADRLDAITWKDAGQNHRHRVLAVMRVVGIVRGISGMWDLMTDSWSNCRGSYTQFAPIALRTARAVPHRSSPRNRSASMVIGFDGSALP